VGKVRVYELAKELGINSKKLIDVLQDFQMDIKNHMSTMDEDVAQKVVELLTKGGIKPPKDEQMGEELKKAGEGTLPSVKEPVPAEQKATPPRKKKEVKKAKLETKEKESRKAKRAARLAATKQAADEEKIVLEGRVTVAELAGRLNITASELLSKLLDLGIVSNINQNLSEDVLAIAAEEYGIKIDFKTDPGEDELQSIMEEEEQGNLKIRPPVVTVLGHVDHGKTSLLDAIRETNVIASEAGGITQHIGAYSVDLDGKKIVFLDTPGHEAFTAMRARGAQVTDIAVLVVAADDGVMPQTVEAINHARAADVPIIVVINKIDRPNANAEKVKKQLAEIGMLPEEWGGDSIFVEVSALKKEGINDLLEMILLVAEMEELSASFSRNARGTIIEAELDKGRGPVATVLIQDGIMRVGDPIICGSIYGKVRAMFDEQGKKITSAVPSMPVEVLGLAEVPQAGDSFLVIQDEKFARQIAEKRSHKLREATLRKVQKVSLDDLFKQIQDSETDLNIIIKADVQGSAEALQESLEKIEHEQVKIKIIHKGAGAINESDVMLASASNAIVIGFNVRPQASARKLAEKEKVEIKLYKVIYEIIEDIKSAMIGLLKPQFQEVILGQAEVRQIFKVSKVGNIAGSYVLEGTINRNCGIRIVRDGTVVHEGKIGSLKRFKDDVKEVSSGYECGILLEHFNDFKEGDVFEAFMQKQVPAS